jgi:hypothetical protein
VEWDTTTTTRDGVHVRQVGLVAQRSGQGSTYRSSPFPRMDLEHNACMKWICRIHLRGALIHTHTEHNHTSGELEFKNTGGSRDTRTGPVPGSNSVATLCSTPWSTQTNRDNPS